MSSVDGDGLTDGAELDVWYILVLVVYVGTLEDCCVGILGGSCKLVTTGSWVLTSLISTVEEDGCTELVVVILTEND